ncbi:respiratory nitrate reductase subunit gamma [Bacillus sp. FJAT-27445]|uniref:respiratory nitrate reductase subunit gamma n=1 Tax=Bacillus sp. FJAT-27445 TaxID=1679166 RepID=UPI0007438201|nr:respiratory nitrate reductase subunit gamma [Bacillus sp. FJAT-27445]
MELFQWFAWLVYPYTVAAVLAMGIVWQYDTPDQFEEMQLKSGVILNRIVKVLWLLTTLTGIGLMIFYRATDELKNMVEWLISFLHFNPDMGLLKHASALLQVHLLLLFTFLLFFSFTKYVAIVFKPIYILKTLSENRAKRANQAR